MWYKQVSAYIHNCACTLAETLILGFRAIIQLMCSIWYILAHNIYACVFPINSCRPIKIHLLRD